MGPDRAVIGRAGQRHRERLQPVDPGWLEIALLLLEADIDEVAGRQHLAGCHGITGFVAINRRQRGNTGKQDQTGQADQNQPALPAQTRAGRDHDCRSSIRPGALVRRTSQITPIVSKMPTNARPILVYFDCPA